MALLGQAVEGQSISHGFASQVRVVAHHLVDFLQPIHAHLLTPLCPGLVEHLVQVVQWSNHGQSVFFCSALLVQVAESLADWGKSSDFGPFDMFQARVVLCFGLHICQLQEFHSLSCFHTMLLIEPDQQSVQSLEVGFSWAVLAGLTMIEASTKTGIKHSNTGATNAPAKKKPSLLNAILDRLSSPWS